MLKVSVIELIKGVWMMENQILLIGLIIIGIIFIAVQSHRARRRKIIEQVQRINIANEHDYRRPDNNMTTTIKDGVTSYRRRRIGEKFR